MATIHVTYKWRVVSDSWGWGLQKKEPAGWAKIDRRYVTLAGAVSGLRDILLRESDATNIKLLKRDAKEISKQLGELMEVVELDCASRQSGVD